MMLLKRHTEGGERLCDVITETYREVDGVV